jgi:hypothetical protein
MKELSKIVKIGLAVILLLCLLDWPYGYYQFVRFASTAGFVFLAVDAYRKQNTGMLIAYILLVLLFQPFEKIALGRTLWNIVDVVVAIGLIISVFSERKEDK